MTAQKTERPCGTEEVVALLKETLTVRGADQWLQAKNCLLNGLRPIELLAEGRVEVVRQAAKAYVEGAYV